MVLDALGLVEHHHTPADRLQEGPVDAHAVVGGHDDSRCDRGSTVAGRPRTAPDHAPLPLRSRPGHEHLALGTRALQGRHGHSRREAGELVQPVEHEGGGAGDEHRRFQPPRVPQALHERDGLERLAEAHLVGEDAAEAEGGEPREPAEALQLVGTQRGGQARRGLHGTARLLHPAQVVLEGRVAHRVGILPIEVERLVGGNLRRAVQKIVGRHAQIAHHLAEMRHIALGKRHDAPVAHAVEALAATQRGEHRRQLVAGHVAVAHVHLNEVRDQRKAQLHPRRPLCHEPIEGRSGEHLARGAELREAPVEQLAG